MAGKMEYLFKPDKKYFTKVLWIQLTISFVAVFIMGIIHSIVILFDGELQPVYIFWLVIIIGLVLMWIVSTIISYLWIKNLKYEINDDRIIIYKGILTKTQQNIPFYAITDFALVRSLYDRILKMGAIKVQTAGQSHPQTSYEGKLTGLVEYENWHSILLDKVKSLHTNTEPPKEPIVEKGPYSIALEKIINELEDIRSNIKKLK